MKLPPDVYFQPEFELLLWKPRGVLNEKVINKIIAFIRDEEAKSDASKRRFIDSTGLTAVELNFRYVFHVALYRRMSRQGRPCIKSAFLIKDPGFEHYFKLHAVLTDHSSLQVQLFQDEQAAAKWLDVSIESLHPSQADR
jgi:hypothetical protein